MIYEMCVCSHLGLEGDEQLRQLVDTLRVATARQPQRPPAIGPIPIAVRAAQAILEPAAPRTRGEVLTPTR